MELEKRGKLPFKAIDLGKRFLLFLPDSHSAYITICIWVEPASPHWVFQGFVALGQVSDRNEGRGGLTHPRLQHWVKWLWEQVWDFSALGGPTSSISRRVVKLTVSRYYSAPLPLQKRGYGDEIRNPVMFMIPALGVGRALVGVACTMAVIFGTRKER